MSTHLSCLRSALLACGVALLLAGSAEAAKKGGDLRVVADDETLVEQRQYTGSTRIPTSKRADCFGKGTGGSGQKVKVPGATALGIIKHAQLSARKLRPLLVTDHFSFGLGLCGIGGYIAPQTGYWYLKVNHVASQAGGDGTPVRQGDEVLWFLIEDFNDPPPVELEIKAPARVRSGEQIPVRAFEYDDAGNRDPAAGVRLQGTKTRTNASGRATVSADRRFTRIRGFREGAIASNTVKVCEGPDCRPGRLIKHIGTKGRDRIKVGRGQSKVSSLAGRDRIDLRRARNAAPPSANCGAGRDLVIARKGQRLQLRPSCERVRRV